MGERCCVEGGRLVEMEGEATSVVMKKDFNKTGGVWDSIIDIIHPSDVIRLWEYITI